jgi:hypothetical protein
MSRYISQEVRRQVAARADFLCEYCLISEEDTYFGCEVEHIISLKHGGSSEIENLAYACVPCNRHKGSDVGSFSHQHGTFSRFFNPRTDRWPDHFLLDDYHIVPLTIIGQVTQAILEFNNSERHLERRALIMVGRYPGKAARSRMEGNVHLTNDWIVDEGPDAA